MGGVVHRQAKPERWAVGQKAKSASSATVAGAGTVIGAGVAAVLAGVALGLRGGLVNIRALVLSMSRWRLPSWVGS